MTEASIGLVETKFLEICNHDDPLILASGKKLAPITIAYETYGTLNKDKNNVILVEHALSGNAHAAGRNKEDDKYPGWWDIYIGPGKPMDTDKYFIISTNVIGSCQGSTGPTSINPKTGKEYGIDFPMVTIQDMVNAQKLFLDKLGISRILTVIGGSMGAMQAIYWSILYPEMVQSCIALAIGAAQPPQAIAFNEVGRQAIYRDQHWHDGNYNSFGDLPREGLALARMIGHITYLSEAIMHEKFGRRLQSSEMLSYEFGQEFMVESYLNYQGEKFVDRFDANSYLYLSKALDYFDPRVDFGASLVETFEKVKSDFLIVSYSSDWLYNPESIKPVIQALRVNGKNVAYTTIQSDKGHDSFLIYDDMTEKNLRNFIIREFEKINGK